MHVHDLFISYSSKDYRFANKISEYLTSSGYTVWLDRHEIKPGDRLRDKIVSGISDSRYFAVILSENSISAPWVKHELNSAILREIESNQVVVVPILFGNIEISDLSSDIRAKLCLDFRKKGGFRENVAKLQDRLGAPPYKYKIVCGLNELDLTSSTGRHASITRRTTIVSLVDGLSSVQEEFFTDGEIVEMSCVPGSVLSRKRTLGKLEMEFSLGKTLSRGDEIEFTLQYSMNDSFLAREEYWLGWTAVPTGKYEYSIMFPVDRPPLSFGHRQKVGASYVNIGQVITSEIVQGRVKLDCHLDNQPVGQADQIFWQW